MLFNSKVEFLMALILAMQILFYFIFFLTFNKTIKDTISNNEHLKERNLGMFLVKCVLLHELCLVTGNYLDW